MTEHEIELELTDDLAVVVEFGASFHPIEYEGWRNGRTYLYDRGVFECELVILGVYHKDRPVSPEIRKQAEVIFNRDTSEAEKIALDWASEQRKSRLLDLAD